MSRAVSSSSRLACAASLCAVLGCTGQAERELARGNEAARRGHFEEAQKAFAAAVKDRPTDAHAHALLGNALCALNRTPEATAAWEEAAKLDPSDADAAVGLSGAALDSKDAGAALKRLSSLPPAVIEGSLQVRLVRARALLARGENGDVEQALADADGVLGRSPADAGAAYLKGSALLALRRFADAQSTFEALARTQVASPLGPYGLARLAAAQSRATDALLYLKAARQAAGPHWTPRPVAEDPAFAFLSTSDDFKDLVRQ